MECKGRRPRQKRKNRPSINRNIMECKVVDFELSADVFEY